MKFSNTQPEINKIYQKNKFIILHINILHQKVCPYIEEAK
jgi:hypothetical protein